SKSDVEGIPGTFFVTAEGELIIAPRLPEFQPLTIAFDGRRIRALTVHQTSLSSHEDNVNEATVEPEALGSFITSIDGETQAKMFVRRYPVQFSDLQDTDLYYAIPASEDSLFMTHNGTR